jgi:hypothetical protein
MFMEQEKESEALRVGLVLSLPPIPGKMNCAAQETLTVFYLSIKLIAEAFWIAFQ